MLNSMFNSLQATKKLLPLCLAILMVFTLAACSGKSESGTLSTSSNAAEQTAAPDNGSNAEGTGADGTKDGGNSDSSSSTAGETQYPLILKNHTMSDGSAWKEKEQIFQQAPERVVANTQGAGELLIRLGLADKVVGVAALYGEVPADIADEFAKLPVLSQDYVGKELVVGAQPDLVLGRGDLFADADWGVGTVDGLNELNIKTYVQNTSVAGATLDSMFQDIEEIGQIFNVQQNAKAYAAQLQQRVDALKQRASAEPLTFAYVNDAGDGAIGIYAGNTDTFQSDVLSLLNIKNSLGDVTGTISVEQLVAINPDILLLSKYTGGPDTEGTIKSFYANEAVQSMKAIQNKQIHVIDFNQFWGYGDQILTGAETLADELGL